jgi:DNA-binding CsgD family transcriptional regulator
VPSPAAADRVVAAGGVVRVCETAACSILVVDRRVAVVSDPGTPAGGETLVTDPPVVQAYLALARDQVHRSWPPSALSADGRLPDPSPIERRVLCLLGSCTSDVEVARHLGITDRQLRRYIRSLQVRLGVRNRFQLGARSAELGWSQQLSPLMSGSGHLPDRRLAPAHRPVR